MRTKFDIWVDKMAREYSKKRRYYFFGLYGVTLCYDTKKNKVGIARQHPEDEWNEQIGDAIAYARCKGYEIPIQKVYKKLSEMENGEIFFSPSSNNKYIYIGKCINFLYNSACVVQNIKTKSCSVITCDEKEYEMVE
jgi:hypothetical protein